MDHRPPRPLGAAKRPPGGPVHVYEATCRDIVPEQRIVTIYVMDLDQTRISVSVATFELEPAGGEPGSG